MDIDIGVMKDSSHYLNFLISSSIFAEHGRLSKKARCPWRVITKNS